jgi:MFS family permease
MTPSQKLFIYLVCTAQFLVLLDFSATNVFAPEILASLGMGESQGFWLMTAFALPYGAFLLIGGRAADWFGEMKVLLVGLGLVVLGNLLCALVGDAVPFLLARGLQGLAAALISPASMVAVVRASRDETERAGALSIFGAVSSLGFSAGLVLAGLVGEYSGWRYFFGGAAILTALVLLPLLLL